MYECDAEDCKRQDERVAENEAHVFSGYGYIAHFHPECCPRDFDGSDCDREHDDAIAMSGHTPWRELKHKASPEQLAEARADLKAELRKVFEPPALRMLVPLNDFLVRHPGPRWLDRAMTALAWPAEQFSRFVRWSFR